MGYSEVKHIGGTVTNFWPDDTADCFYVALNATLEDIIEKAEAKWGDIDYGKIHIEPQYIHTDCLYYDRYDSGDYTNFLCISKKD